MTDTRDQFWRWIAYIRGLPYFQRRLEIAKRVEPKLSRFLYKFRSIDPENETAIDRTRDILVASRLWLSAPVDFNDPFDTRAKVVLTGQGLDRRRRLEQVLKAMGLSRKERKRRLQEIMKISAADFEKYLNARYDEYLEKVGVYSFAGDPQNILMWSHYASNHTGICIQFERARDLRVLIDALGVDYCEDYPTIDWVESFAGDLSSTILRKHGGWKYEDESRIVLPEYARKYIGFYPSAITAVIFGCEAKQTVRDVVLKLLDERRDRGHPDVKLYTARRHREKYKLVICRMGVW